MDLLEYPDSRVQALVAARPGTSPPLRKPGRRSLSKQRAEGEGSDLPELLGARVTGRDSGEFDQHTEPPSAGRQKVLREAIVARAVLWIVVGDSSNIELRVNLTMSGHTDYLDRIRMYDTQGDAATSDLYCEFASELYGREILKETSSSAPSARSPNCPLATAPVRKRSDACCLLRQGFGGNLNSASPLSTCTANGTRRCGGCGTLPRYGDPSYSER